MSKLIFITGGARSGKSSFAESLALNHGGRVVYIATCTPLDDEMRTRVRLHQDRRPGEWLTIEEPKDVAHAVQRFADNAEVILVDCLTLLVSNLLLEGELKQAREEKAIEEKVIKEIEGLVDVSKRGLAHVIIVSNETGCGIVPEYPLGRAYRDLLGRANQIVASAAGEVHLCVAGIPIEIKAHGQASPTGQSEIRGHEIRCHEDTKPQEGVSPPPEAEAPPHSESVCHVRRIRLVRTGPVRSFLIAFQFLTSIPLTLRGHYGPEDSAKAMAYFPMVGAILGVILVAMDISFGKFLPRMPVTALVIFASALLTRGLHLDGLADTADGLFGGHSREQTLKIMRDSRIGTFGVVAVLGFYLLKFAILSGDPPPIRWASLLLAPTLGRYVMVWAASVYPYARQEGLGKAYTEFVSRREVVASSLTLILVTIGTSVLAGLPWDGMAVLLGSVFLVAVLTARAISRRLGGMTGDTFGALNEVTELAVFLLAPLCLGLGE